MNRPTLSGRRCRAAAGAALGAFIALLAAPGMLSAEATEEDPRPNRFIILSDLHPHPDAFEQVDILADHVIALQPAFVFVLGDICGHDLSGVSEREIEVVREAFNRMRAAGIEIFPIMGNHDVHRRAEEIKVEWFSSQEPLPLNHLFEANRNTPAYRAFRDRGPYNYAFTAGGIHFAVVDSNIIPPRESWDAERIQRERPRWEAHRKWMEDHLCGRVTNPDGYPTIVFLHHPEYMTGDRRMVERPLYRVLAECEATHTVRAVFGGHWHYGYNWPRGHNLGVDVYATPASVHGLDSPVEFIVADVSEGQITFEPRETVTGRVRRDREPVKYFPVYGSFGALRSVDASGTRREVSLAGEGLDHDGGNVGDEVHRILTHEAGDR